MNESLDEHFPPECGVKIIAEPGRYFVASAFTLCTNIIAKRDVISEEGNYFLIFLMLKTAAYMMKFCDKPDKFLEKKNK